MKEFNVYWEEFFLFFKSGRVGQYSPGHVEVRNNTGRRRSYFPL